MRFCKEEVLSLLPVLLVSIVLGVSLYATITGRDRVKRALRDSFAALQFHTPQGMVSGGAVQIVKVYTQGMRHAYGDVFAVSFGAQHVHDSFWYCVAPGPSYFLAIPLVEAGFGRVAVRWVVRLLTEERMRAALQDDSELLGKLFGTSGSSA